jgi:hypothetical protein
MVSDVLSAAHAVRDLRIQLEADDPGHLPPDVLMAHADGLLEGEELQNARDHLEECDACRSEIAEIEQLKTLLRRPRRWVFYAAAAAAIAAMAIVLPPLMRTLETPAPPPRGVAVPATPVPPVPSPPEGIRYSRSQWENEVAAVKERRQLPIPAVVQQLQSVRSGLRGNAERGDLRLSPDSEVVMSSRPRLTWAARDEATYKVILQAGDEIVESSALTEPEWTPPNDLPRGREYLWQVELTVDGARSVYPRRPDPPARFRVLGQDALAEITEARTRHPDDPLLHAVILARHGLRGEALEAVDRLQQRDPSLAKALRDSLQKWPEVTEPD